MNQAQKIWDAVKGYKTYVIALAAIIYGVYTKDTNLIIIGLGLAGIRNGISTEVAKVLVAKNPKAAAKKAAPTIAADVAEAAVTEIK